MLIDPKAEKPTRDMLGHAIRGELQELAMAIQAAGNETYRQSIALCLLAAGYVGVDVCKRWPTNADIREIARNASEAEDRLDLTESDFYDFLSGSVFGDQPLDLALGTAEAAMTLPVLLTGSLLLTFRPRPQKWWDYLDTIENALDVAAGIDASVLPALTLLTRRRELKTT
jgi:hypothetical protein